MAPSLTTDGKSASKYGFQPSTLYNHFIMPKQWLNNDHLVLNEMLHYGSIRSFFLGNGI